MRKAWGPVALLVVATLALGGAVALVKLGPCEEAHQHRYIGNARGEMPTLLPEPGCPGDEATLALGGAFLREGHHKGAICVSDLVLAEVTYSIARDGNGDGAVTPGIRNDDRLVGPYRSGVCTLPPFPAGADGGWWVLLEGDATRGDISS